MAMKMPKSGDEAARILLTSGTSIESFSDEMMPPT
jgi:hypothetical protein